MLTLNAAIFLLGASQAALLYGGDATLATELAEELRGRHWSLQPMAVEATGATAHPGEALYIQGRKAYDELLFEEAIPRLQEAVTTLESTTLTPEQWRTYIDASLTLALTYEAIGNTDGAETIFDRLAVHAPGEACADIKYPPAFRERVAERMRKKPVKSGNLRIESVPEGATVFVNGRMAGVTPLLIDGLPGASHTVTLRLAKFQSHTQRVDVRGGFGIGAEATPEWVKAKLTPLEGPEMAEAAATLKSQRLPDTRTTARLLGTARATAAQASFFLTHGPEGLVAAALHADGTWRGPALFAADTLRSPPRRAQLIKQLVYWTKNEVPVQPVKETKLAQEKPSSRWWLWTGLGVLVAGGATAAAIASQPDRPAPTQGEVIIGW